MSGKNGLGYVKGKLVNHIKLYLTYSTKAAIIYGRFCFYKKIVSSKFHFDMENVRSYNLRWGDPMNPDKEAALINERIDASFKRLPNNTLLD